MVNQYLRQLGFDDNTINRLPKDILDAATIYELIQKTYVEIPSSEPEQKAFFAKNLAEGTRNLLLRINSLVTTSGVAQTVVNQQISQLPKPIRPHQIPQPPSSQHTPIVHTPPTPPTETETYGLEVGDNLPYDIITEWARLSNNYNSDLSQNKWVDNPTAFFNGDKTILKIETIDGVVGFLVGGSANTYLRAEGFKNFMDIILYNFPVVIEPTTSIKFTNQLRFEIDRYSKLQGVTILDSSDSRSGIYPRIRLSERLEIRDGMSNELKELLKKQVETNKPEPILDTFGLKVGDKIPEEILNAWAKQDFNFFDERSPQGWRKVYSDIFASGRPRIINGFKVFDGVVGFLLSGTLVDGFGWYLRAEGFKEFMENYLNQTSTPPTPPTPTPPPPTTPKPTKPKKSKKEPSEKEKELIRKMQNVQF